MHPDNRRIMSKEAKTLSERIHEYIEVVGTTKAHIAKKVLKLKYTSSFTPKLARNEWSELQKDRLEEMLKTYNL